MESEVLLSSLLEIQDSINIIWDFILISFRLFGEPDGYLNAILQSSKDRIDIVSTSMTTFWDIEALKYPNIKIHFPETFEKLQKVPLDKLYNILMSLDKIELTCIKMAL